MRDAQSNTQNQNIVIVWISNKENKGFSTPMTAGTEHDNNLAYTPDELAIAQKQNFGFGFVISWGVYASRFVARLDI
jgi:hypothetical protein